MTRQPFDTGALTSPPVPLLPCLIPWWGVFPRRHCLDPSGAVLSIRDLLGGLQQRVFADAMDLPAGAGLTNPCHQDHVAAIAQRLHSTGWVQDVEVVAQLVRMRPAKSS